MAIEISTVLQRLSSIHAPPNLRSTPKPGDLDGKFDRWFDGGALKVVTGWNEYHFADGTLAYVPTTPELQIEIRFPSGAYVTISERDQASPGFTMLNQ
jgi:hypothetical protein